MTLTDKSLKYYVTLDLPSGRRLLVWRVGMFPVGLWIESRVCEKKSDNPEHWSVTDDHESFVGAPTVEEFLKKNSLPSDGWVEIAPGTATIDM